MKEALCKEFCDQINIRQVPAGLAVGTSFIGLSGDPIGFYVIGPSASGTFRIEDSGSTVPTLEASGADLELPSRAQAFAELLAQHEALYDIERGEIKTPPLKEEDVPRAALKFVALLLRIQDLILMTKERAESTFREEAFRDVEVKLGQLAAIKRDDVVSDELRDFQADIVIRVPNRPPVAVFLVMGDAKLYEAMLLQSEAQLKARVACRVVALIERETSVSQRAFRQALNRLVPLWYRGDEKAAIERIARESVGYETVH